MKLELRIGTTAQIRGLRTRAVLQSIVAPRRSLPMNAHGLTMQMTSPYMATNINVIYNSKALFHLNANRFFIQ